MTNIQIFGDSVLKGVVYDEARGRYKLCKENRLTIPGVTVQNHSKMGATVEDGLAIIDKRWDLCNGDTLALLELGGNDCNYRWEEVSARPEATHFCAVEPVTFQKKMKLAVEKLQSTGATVMLSSLVPLYAPKFMNWISQGLNRQNILHWLGDVDHLFRWQAMYNQMVLEIAEETGCDVLDLRGDFLCEGYGDFLCADGIHPTQEGHEKIRKTMEGYFGE